MNASEGHEHDTWAADGGCSWCYHLAENRAAFGPTRCVTLKVDDRAGMRRARERRLLAEVRKRGLL